MDLTVNEVVEYFNVEDIFIEVILGMNSEMNYFKYEDVEFFWRCKTAYQCTKTKMFVTEFYYLDDDVKVRAILDPFDNVNGIEDYLTKN